jgi:hypothetical protein
MDCNLIVPYLYLGSAQCSYFYDKFDFIVNLCPECNITLPNNAILIKIFDNPSENNKLIHVLQNNPVLQKIYHHIKRKEKVLIHCAMGIQRSSTIVACYLIKYYGYSPQNAIEFIKSKRSVAFINGVNFQKTINTSF